MSRLKLTMACGNYDRTRALIDGTVQAEGVDLNYLPMVPGETFWRMLNNAEFDVAEMSLSSYTILRSRGDERFIALPVFTSRIFRHSAIYINADAGISVPGDLKGKRIGVADYQMTAAVWVRGLLQDDYQVRPEDLSWTVGTAVQQIELPKNVSVRSAGQDAPETLLCMCNLGDALYEQGKSAEAEAIYREELAGQRRTAGHAQRAFRVSHPLPL